jgi:hypothetical protein
MKKSNDRPSHFTIPNRSFDSTPAMTTTVAMVKLAPLPSASAPHQPASKGSLAPRFVSTRGLALRLALISLVGCLSVSYGQQQTMGCMDGPDRPGSCEETFTDATDCYIDQQGSCEPEVAKCRSSCGTAGCACRFNQYECIQPPCPGTYFCGGEVTACSTFDTEGSCGLESGCVWGLLSDGSSPPSDVPSMVPAAPSAPTAIVPEGAPSALPTIVSPPTAPTTSGGGGGPGSTSGAAAMTSVRSTLAALAFGTFLAALLKYY